MDKFAPIVFFGYARPDHTAETLQALARNPLAKESIVYAFCDGPRNEKAAAGCEQVRELIRNLSGFKDVQYRFSDVNKGLKNSIIQGVSEVVERHGKAIIVEDDMVSTPYFLSFLNEGLERYEKEDRVFSVCGYAPPMKKLPKDYPFDAFFSYRNMAWGWSTWADRWRKADFEVKGYAEFLANPAEMKRWARGGSDTMRLLKQQMEGRADTWDVQWNFTLFTHDAYALLPVYSHIQNIGADGTGTHFKGTTDRYWVDLSLAREIKRWPERIEVDPAMAKAFRLCYARTLDRAVKKAVRIVRESIRV